MTLLFIALAWCAGVAVAALGAAAWWPAVAISGAAFAAGCGLARRLPEALLGGALALVAIGGIARYEAARPAASDLATLHGAEATLRGIVEAVEQSERTQQVRLRVAEVLDEETDAWREVRGDVLLTLRPFPELEYGDSVTMKGKLEAPPKLDGFDYRAYLGRQGIHSVSLFPATQRTAEGGGGSFTRAVIEIRTSLARGIERSMPEPEAALAKGILLGERSSIPDDVSDDFNRSGLSHLIAISGYNVMLVAACVTGLLWPLMGRRPALLAAMAIIVAYAVLVGGEPSVLRAALMGIVVLGAEVFGRPGRSLHALTLAVAALLVAEPGLIDEVSFQLSVVATAGIVLGARRLADSIGILTGGILRGGAGGVVAEQLAVSAAASIAVLPVMALTFERVSLVALPANLLAGPSFLLALAGSLAGAVAGLIDQELGRLVGQAAYLPLAYLVMLAHWFGSQPFASTEVGWPAAALVTFVCAAALILVSRRRAASDEERAPRFRLRPQYAASAALLTLGGALWWQSVSPPEDRLQVTVLDVGQGDAILIETPDGRIVLVDGGPSGPALLNELGATLAARERRIDLVVLTHSQEDHVTGLAFLSDRYDVVQALAGPRQGGTAAYEAWRLSLREAGTPVTLAEAGARADLGGGIALEVLGPPPLPVGGEDVLNENSVVLRLTYRDISFLLTGDIGFEAEQALLNGGMDVRATVLKVAHHGSDGSTSAAFLSAVQPAVAVISSGAENLYGHPSPSTRLRLAGIPLYRTDLNGRVRFLTDGRRLWAQTEWDGPELVNAVRSEN